MKRLVTFFVSILFLTTFVYSQSDAEKIFRTEKLFEQAVREKGIRDAFIEFLAPTSIMFMPGPVNGRDVWKSKQPTNALLSWNPILIDVSSNGSLGYSIGNSRFRPAGVDDPKIVHGHYISIWMRMPSGEFRAVLDTGIHHDKPADEPVAWKDLSNKNALANSEKIAASDSSTSFYEAVSKIGARKAYKDFLADDVILLREGKQPVLGKKAALKEISSVANIAFSKRKSFTEAAELAYVFAEYSIADKAAKELERGNFVQVWKLFGKRWLVVADVFVPLPKSTV